VIHVALHVAHPHIDVPVLREHPDVEQVLSLGCLRKGPAAPDNTQQRIEGRHQEACNIALPPFAEGAYHSKKEKHDHGSAFCPGTAGQDRRGWRRYPWRRRSILDHDIWFRQKVKSSLDRLDSGEFLTHEDVGERLELMFRD
jgi:hypothetical protein